jgi:hypothetical protein
MPSWFIPLDERSERFSEGSEKPAEDADASAQ